MTSAPGPPDRQDAQPALRAAVRRATGEHALCVGAGPALRHGPETAGEKDVARGRCRTLFIARRLARPGWESDSGEFRIWYMNSDTVSTIFGERPMPYAIFYDGNVAIHYSDDFLTRWAK